MTPILSWQTCPTCLGAKGVWEPSTFTGVAAAFPVSPQFWMQCPRCLGTGCVVSQQEPAFESAKDGAR